MCLTVALKEQEAQRHEEYVNVELGLLGAVPVHATLVAVDPAERQGEQQDAEEHCHSVNHQKRLLAAREGS